jgi:electron transfer flavoprotein beta subunit
VKVLVPVKRVIDHNVKPRLTPDGTGIDLTHIKMNINPFDEIAVEEAVRLKEQGFAGEVVAVSIGPAGAQDTLRTALAIGADRAILIQTGQAIEPLAVAKLLKAVVDDERPGLVILGQQAIDDDCNQTGQMLAALTGRPQGTFASKLRIHGDRVEVTREVDNGSQTLSLALPAIVTAGLRLNAPRYAGLSDILKARAKPLAQTTPAALGVDITPRLALVRVAEPARRPPGSILPDVDALVVRLKALIA